MLVKGGPGLNVLNSYNYVGSVINLEIMPMRHPAPWMVEQCAIAAGNAPNKNFNGPETHA